MFARIADVKPRRRSDPMSISSASDFRYGTAEAVDPTLALDNPSVTLYCLDRAKNEAVFVECDEGVALADAPFYYQGQFQHARRAIIVPFDELHAAAKQRGDRFQQAIMIHSVGRCGSTLLSKMFGRLDACLSLSEPDVQTNLIADVYSPDEQVNLLQSANRFYFQPPANRQPTHLVLKFRSFCIELATAMEAATPSTRTLFLYRDVESVVRSGMRAFRYGGAPLWWMDKLHRALVTRPVLWCGLQYQLSLGRRLFPVLQRFTAWELTQMGAVGILAIAWLSAMERCLQLQRDGMMIPAIRYDDLIADPPAITAALADYCRFPAGSGEEMINAMNDDSQRGSIIARGRQSDYELSARDRDTLCLVLSRSDSIDRGDFGISGNLRNIGNIG